MPCIAHVNIWKTNNPLYRTRRSIFAEAFVSFVIAQNIPTTTCIAKRILVVKEESDIQDMYDVW